MNTSEYVRNVKCYDSTYSEQLLKKEGKKFNLPDPLSFNFSQLNGN